VSVAPVPDIYIGLWERTLLDTPTLRDTTSRVFWLQTESWHADIRIPADRPACSGHGSLATLSEPELLALSRQQGFAGITEVSGELCRWHRQMDYQPPSGFNDVGRMRFEGPDRLLEYGVEQPYFEVWQRVAESSGGSGTVDNVADGDGRSLLLRTGSWFMLVRPRVSGTLSAAANLSALVAAASANDRVALLDFEISLARSSANGTACIELSTLPWREGQRFVAPAPIR
jgi:hypothetical protein